MVIASSKNAEMRRIFYLPQQHPLTLDSLPDGRYYTKNHDCIVLIPPNCALFWCPYTGDFTDEDHSWTNPKSRLVHTTHPLGFTVNSDNSFFDGFYEITEIEVTFGEGDKLCPDTNAMICVEKTDAQSVWNPFFQRYDPPCDRDTCDCELHRINYDFVNESFHKIFPNMTIFYEFYCKCCRCEYCSNIHIGTCAEMCKL